MFERLMPGSFAANLHLLDLDLTLTLSRERTYCPAPILPLGGLAGLFPV